MPVVIERTGLRTMAYGSRDGDRLELPKFRWRGCAVGDRLLTSGLGGRFPPGFPGRRDRSVAPAATGMFQVAQARPAADLDRSGDVLLLHDQAEPDGPPSPRDADGPPGQPGARRRLRLRRRRHRQTAEQRDEQARLSLWWFIGTLVFALLSMLVPLPGVLEPFKPYWSALFLLYWSLESEDRVTLGLAFVVGLAAICSTASCSPSRRCGCSC